MNIKNTIVLPDGTVEEREIEVDDNYFDTSAPEPVDPITALQEQVSELISAQQDTDALAIDSLFRVTLLELGL